MTARLATGLFVLVAATAACGGGADGDARPSDTGDIVDVTTERASMLDVPDVYEAGGVLVSKQVVVLSARVMAPIVRIAVQPGDRVRRGQVLVELESDDADVQVARANAGTAASRASAGVAVAERDAAQAALALATATHARIATLQQERSATTQELDDAVAALRQAESRVAAATAGVEAAARAVDVAETAGRAAAIAHGWTTLRAPIDGLVTARHTDAGSMAAPGQPLLTLEAPGALQMEVRMDASRAASVVLGQSVEVQVETGPESSWLPARVVEIARVDPTSHSFVVTLDAPAQATWRSGLFGRARFAGPPAARLTIPASAVVERGQLTLVFQVGSESTARLRMVSLGRTAGDRVEVLSGLGDGDVVITRPPATLTDGTKVRP